MDTPPLKTGMELPDIPNIPDLPDLPDPPPVLLPLGPKLKRRSASKREVGTIGCMSCVPLGNDARPLDANRSESLVIHKLLHRWLF